VSARLECAYQRFVISGHVGFEIPRYVPSQGHTVQDGDVDDSVRPECGREITLSLFYTIPLVEKSAFPLQNWH
jgi:hypothetical protein